MMPPTSSSSGALPNSARSRPRRAPLSPSAFSESRYDFGMCEAPSAVIGSAWSGPTVASSMIARSVTDRASGPAMSCVDDSGITPVRLDSPCVPRRPTRFWFAAGIRIDPHVSLPMPAAAKLAPIAAPVPPLDPPGTRIRSYGLRVWFVSDEIVVMPAASSCMVVLPRITAPASRRRFTWNASAAGCSVASPSAPPEVGMSAVS